MRSTAVAVALTAATGFGLAFAQQADEGITLPREVVAAAAAFQGYMDRASTISAGFKSGDAVHQGLKTGVGYEQAQFQQGMIGYAAIAALQDDNFVEGIRRAARRSPDRHALVEQLLADPSHVMTIDGAQGAARRAQAALQRRADAVFSNGRAVKQSAYDVQHSAWSKARVPNPQGRLAEVKSLSAARTSFVDGDEARLVRTLLEQNRMSDGAEAPTPVMVRSLALAAIAVLGEARTKDLPRLQPLFVERTSADCLRMAKLNLYQCMAVAGPHYEDIFCLGQHALMDTGQCVAKAASYTPAPSAPAMSPATRVASGSATYRQASSLPLGAAPTMRTFRAD